MVNRPSRLHQIAGQIRDDYVALIGSINDQFLSKRLVSRGLSLFHISDCSCKRTEFFKTYESICNLLCLKEIVEEYRPDSIFLVGGTKSFFEGLKTVCGKVRVVPQTVPRKKWEGLRFLVSDIGFVTKVFLVVTITYGLGAREKTGNWETKTEKKLFFSIFPKMTDLRGNDRKYGEFIKESDGVAVTILADGLHQKISIRQYFAKRKWAQAKRFQLIDDHLSIYSCLEMLGWVARLRWKLFLFTARYSFQGIDVSESLRYEVLFSLRRMARLTGFRRSLEKFLQVNKCSCFNYYLHEYPIGRVISSVLEKSFPDVWSVGWQHGPVAWRKLVYFMDPNELGREQQSEQRVPIPKEIVAEDDNSVEIYEHAGYPNVKKMDRVYRLSYLDQIVPKKKGNLALVVPGLHDGPQLLRAVTDWDELRQYERVLFKPHPNGSEDYLDESDDIPNLEVVHTPINQLLEQVSTVIVTYSSVGPEAVKLGLRTVVIDIPGKINESPLLDEVGANSVNSPIARYIPEPKIAI